MERMPYMDMLHPRSHYALMATEAQVRSHRHERAMVDRLEGSTQAPRPTPAGPRRWSVGSVVRFFTPIRQFGAVPRAQEE